jgi:PKD-like domain/Secretion system C-terminal sorting domain
MKKQFITLLLSIAGFSSIWGQCAPSCSNYIVSPITFTTFSGLGGGSGYGVNEQLLSDDQTTGPLAIGFTFSFMCNTYTQFVISSNGFISFDLAAPNGCCQGQLLPDPNTPSNLISLFWNDLYPPGGGTVTYALTGVSPNQMLIVTYTNIPFCCTVSPPFSSGQIVLYEGTNVIDMYVSNQQGNFSSPMTQGIENANGTIAYTAPGRNASAWTATNSAYRWTPTNAPTTPGAITGNTTACVGSQVNFVIPPSPGATSYTWSLPGGWTGSSTTTALTATVGASGNISVSAVYTCGVSSPTTIAFTTIPPPTVVFQSVNPPLVCSGSPVTINTSGALTYTLEPGSITNGPPFTITPAISTVYTLTGTNVNGCVSINNPTVSVTVNQTPTVTVNSGAICLGESFTLTPSGANVYTLSSGFSIVTPNTAGVQTYTVVGTNSTGCVSQPAICSLTVNALPNVTASSTRTTICRNESTTLTASGALSYSWNTGPTTAAIVVSPLSNTNYTVTGIDANNCAKKASINVVVSLCLGLNETTADQPQLVSVFPNPSNGEFTLKANESTEFQIFDVQGKLIKTLSLPEGSHKIDLSAYASGEYILKASTKDKTQQVLLIKE